MKYEIKKKYIIRMGLNICKPKKTIINIKFNYAGNNTANMSINNHIVALTKNNNLSNNNLGYTKLKNTQPKNIYSMMEHFMVKKVENNICFIINIKDRIDCKTISLNKSDSFTNYAISDGNIYIKLMYNYHEKLIVIQAGSYFTYA